jgi:hypothetical protein
MAWMPAGSPTIEELRAKNEELRARIAAARIAKGKPPEPPEGFIDKTLSYVLLEHIKPFYPIAVQYSSIIAKGGLVPVDTGKFDEYRRWAELLRMSTSYHVSFFASGVLKTLHLMEEVNEVIREGRESQYDIGWALRRLRLYLDFFEMNDLVTDEERGDLSYSEFYKKEQAKTEELKADSKRLAEETGAAWAHYRAIEHLI